MLEPDIRKELHIKAKEDQFYIRCVVRKDIWILDYFLSMILEPKYGSQRNWIEQWINGENHKTAFLAFWGNELVGFLCLKNNPDKNYLKISTMFILTKFRHRGRGSFFLEVAENLTRVYCKSELSVTVSEKDENTIGFFRSKDFKVIDKLKDKYQKGTTEVVLKKILK
jgi:ribosomal protein S18 acetylase RimI-like enzyme